MVKESVPITWSMQAVSKTTWLQEETAPWQYSACRRPKNISCFFVVLFRRVISSIEATPLLPEEANGDQEFPESSG